jgi:hypothetical protein
MIKCRHCGDSFTALPGKPGFVDECPVCLAERNVFVKAKDAARSTSKSEPLVSILELPSHAHSFKAKYDTSCLGCKQPIQKGNDVVWAGPASVWHHHCFREARVSERDRSVRIGLVNSATRRDGTGPQRRSAARPQRPCAGLQ